MGLNYYVVKNHCEACDRQDTEHIGKSSMGWKFLFQGSDTIRDYMSWLTNVNNAEKIQDEYGRDVELNELLNLIGSKHNAKCHMLDNDGSYWHDQWANDFCGSDFS